MPCKYTLEKQTQILEKFQNIPVLLYLKGGIIMNKTYYSEASFTAWKVSKYGVFSGPYFPVFGLNTEI